MIDEYRAAMYDGPMNYTPPADLLARYPEPFTALMELGKLVESEEGTYWSLTYPDGTVHPFPVFSDSTAEWLANSAVGGDDFADWQEDCNQ